MGIKWGNDVFISYARLDNQELKKGKGGWITIFHHFLGVLLSEKLGRKAKIWRDDKLHGNDEFGKEITEVISKTKVLIVVISPSYMNSEWCKKELGEFLKAAGSNGGCHTGNKSRIFKVVKNYVPHENHPDKIRGFLGYEFFQRDEYSGWPEFRPEEGAPFQQDWIKKVDDLASDIGKLIEALDQPDAVGIEYPGNPPEKTVYLAETTYDLNHERDNILRDLKQQGYDVLPDRDLPLRLKDGSYRDTVRECMERCKLSIHLIGNQYGLIPEGETRDIIDLQTQEAADLCKNKRLTRLIWIPPGLDKSKGEERQKEYITKLQEDAACYPGTEILEGSLEDLKTHIYDTLKRINEPGIPADDLTRVYLVCDALDAETVKPLKKCFREKKIEVMLPLFEGEPLQCTEVHKENLKLCDAMMIYYDHANEYWMKTKLNDLRKVPGYERTGPLKAKTIFVTGKETWHKNEFDTLEAEVIKEYDPLYCEVIAPFISRLTEKDGGSR